jgi:NDMA-dependent alcohol dehydrogenase
MKCQAAVLYAVGQEWHCEELTVGSPATGEVLVQWKVAGLCHSDEHAVTGDMVPTEDMLRAVGETTIFPMVGGHEGAGVVVETGPGVTSVQTGDHVAASFVPSCGRCRYCITGRQNLCDLGAATMAGGMITDGTHKHHAGDQPVTMMAKVGTFAEFACVSENSIVKVDRDYPFEVVAVVSCGVATGWGSATTRADVRPGETVVVVGIGGIGINAVQGARAAGARRVIAVDPVEFKRSTALKLGATHAFASMEEALPAVVDLTAGQLADKVVMAPGVMRGELLQLGMALAGKDAIVVVTGIAPVRQTSVALDLFELAMWNKQIRGTIFGSLNPRFDIQALLALYRDGKLYLDELITNRYALPQINRGYQDMRDGMNIRGVIVHSSPP